MEATTQEATTQNDQQQTSERAFAFLRTNDRSEKPRKVGVTEVRGPYYSSYGLNHMEDLFRTMGEHIDSFKYAGGSFSLMPRDEVAAMNDFCHEHDVLVSTGGFIESVLARGGADAVHQYVEECSALNFDIVEISAGFISLPTDDWLRLIETVQEAGLKAKPEVGIQFGAGGDTPTEELESEGQQDPAQAIRQARRFIEAGAYMVMMESEGITENVPRMRTEVPARFIEELGLEKLMFEASAPEVFAWYVKNYGPEVNLFVDHSQIVQLEGLRSGIWGTKDLFGRVLTYKG